jgi:hypothetical protein
VSNRSLSVPGSFAFNFKPTTPASSKTKAIASNIKGTAINNLTIDAIQGADFGAYAGSLGIAANPLESKSPAGDSSSESAVDSDPVMTENPLLAESSTSDKSTSESTSSSKESKTSSATSTTPPAETPSTSTSSQVAATFGISVAVNDLSVEATASLSDSTLTTLANATLSISAMSSDVNLQTISASGAGSSSSAPSTSTGGSYAISGAGAGAENKYTSPITAIISNSTVSAAASSDWADLFLTAKSDEEILAITGGVDVAIARGSGTGSSGASPSVFQRHTTKSRERFLQ